MLHDLKPYKSKKMMGIEMLTDALLQKAINFFC